jgi:hypothetical protein
VQHAHGTRPSRQAKLDKFLLALLVFGCSSVRPLPLPPGHWNRNVVQWSGLTWHARSGNDHEGPGSNLWRSDTGAIHVTPNGYLELVAGGRPWRSVELAAELPPGPVRVTLWINDPTAIDPGLIAAIFLYRDDSSELDFEFGRWGHPETPNAQFVIAPGRPGQIRRFEAPAASARLQIDFSDHRVCFFYTSAQRTHSFCKEASDVPSPAGHRLHLNLWALPGTVPQRTSRFVLRRALVQSL